MPLPHPRRRTTSALLTGPVRAAQSPTSRPARFPTGHRSGYPGRATDICWPTPHSSANARSTSCGSTKPARVPRAWRPGPPDEW